MKEFDIAIIGGGPAGYVGAIRARQLGASVCLIEKDKVGGTCLNRGCIPTKALYYSAKAVAAVKKLDSFGVSAVTAGFDVKAAVARKDEVVKKLVSGVEQLLKGNGVTLLRGRGAFEAANRLRVVGTDGSVEIIAAKKIIIATGSEPASIPAFNIDGVNVITSTEALNVVKVPESLLIIGGGVMGCEFANIFSKFGSKVTVVEMLPSILAIEDKMVARAVAKSFKESGVEVLTEVSVDAVDVANGGVRTRLKDGREFVTEKVLVSIGRSFNSEKMGLDAAGVEVERGRIKTNERFETTAKDIYAVGDVKGGMLLAHVASVEAGLAVENALGAAKTMNYAAVPYGIFTDPEIASVGLKEKDAKEKGIEVEVGRFPYAASGKALTMGETEGFTQIIAEKGTDKVLGCSIVGAHATDLIGEAALAIKAGLKVKDIAETVHAHPTLPEIVMEAAEDVHGLAVHKIGRR